MAHAYVLRHDDRPRPWLVSIHPTGVGSPVDMRWMGSRALHRELGINVMHPVLPKHGPRRRRGQSRVSFPSPDGVVNLQAFSQAVWDVRRAIAWARLQGATRVGLHGLSLGGYTAALLAGIEDDLDCVIVGLPPSDLPALMVRHASRYLTAELAAEELAPIGSLASRRRQPADLAARVAAPRLRRDRRFVYAAVGDRVATPEQAVGLWRHWDEPDILWIQSSHLPAPMLRETRRFVRDALRRVGNRRAGTGVAPVVAADPLDRTRRGARRAASRDALGDPPQVGHEDAVGHEPEVDLVDVAHHGDVEPHAEQQRRHRDDRLDAWRPRCRSGSAAPGCSRR